MRLRRRPFLAGVLTALILLWALRYLVNRTPVADWLVSPLLTSDTSGRADAIVALGAGVVDECSANLHGVRRALLAARLWREQRAAILVFTGGSDQPGCPGAKAMAHVASDAGVPRTAMILETTARNTRQNAEFTAGILRPLGVRRVLIVTDRLHMPRATAVFARQGFAIEHVAVPVPQGHEDNVSMLVAGGREALALAYYRLRGWTGDHPSTGRSAPAGTSGDDAAPARASETPMQADPKYPAGPLVILGASYAGGWGLKTVAGVPVVNRGLSGQQSFEMLARFERDVVAARPRAVLLWGFINDIFRSDPLQTDATLARVTTNYERMVAEARRQGIEPILATEVTAGPTGGWMDTIAGWVGRLRGKQSYQDTINRRVLEVNRWLLAFAHRENLLILDFQGALGEPGGRRRSEFTKEDGSHITEIGYSALTDYARPILERHLSASDQSH